MVVRWLSGWFQMFNFGCLLLKTRNQLNVTNGIQMAIIITTSCNYFFNVIQCIIAHKILKPIHTYILYKSLKTFVQESEEGETTWKPTFLGHHSFYITPKRCTSESPFSDQLLKLIWESGNSFLMLGLSKVTENAPNVW